MRDGGRYGDQRDGKTPGQSVHFRLPTHHPFVPTRVHVAGENIEQLVNDLQDACADPDTPYFLGSLILVKDGPTQYQVIDGQQRLISLSIIVSVLRELEDDPDLIDSLNDLILEPGDKLRGIKAEPRLTLRERDTDFFRMYVQEGDLEGLFDLRDNDIASHAQRNIAVNTRRTFDLLAAMDAKTAADSPHTWSTASPSSSSPPTTSPARTASST